MAAFLSAEWLELQPQLAADLPERPGASARMQIVVTGTPEGEVAYVQQIEDGRLTAASLGRDDAADVTLTQTHADAVAIARGDLDANAAFMQGRVKVTGNMGSLMALMPLTQSAEYQTFLAGLAEQTEF
ncbi:MAG: SCP2 sterol-binding domain-containing protein [Acidimicrobiales bacterium]